jgi:hypothetical protein
MLEPWRIAQKVLRNAPMIFGNNDIADEHAIAHVGFGEHHPSSGRVRAFLLVWSRGKSPGTARQYESGRRVTGS